MEAVKVYEETEATISLHGLGFIQVKLPAKQRLHVWHPELPRRACFKHSQIHDHRFGFISRVLVGEQINHVYGFKASKEVPPTHIAYLHEGERTQFGNRPWIEDYRLCVTPWESEVVYAGCLYTMEPYVFHATEPGNGGKVATLLTKTSEGDSGAHSLCEIGIAPDADFDRKQLSENELWAFVRDVLAG